MTTWIYPPRVEWSTCQKSQNLSSEYTRSLIVLRYSRRFAWYAGDIISDLFVNWFTCTATYHWIKKTTTTQQQQQQKTQQSQRIGKNVRLLSKLLQQTSREKTLGLKIFQLYMTYASPPPPRPEMTLCGSQDINIQLLLIMKTCKEQMQLRLR